MNSDRTLPPSDHRETPGSDPPFRLPERQRSHVGQRIGPFEVVGEIARGGQGVVLRARQPGMTREVALKLLLRPTPKGRLRFRQEGQVLAKINHPNIMRVIDLGEHEGLPFLAMELLDAKPLDADVETQGPPPVPWLVEILAQIADSLAHCHDLGLVHRDLKPDNILVERATGRPILVDFGLVKRDRERFGELSIDEYTRLSQTGHMQGTPAWMAPEQIMNKGTVGPPTDVHALGMILFALLTGRRPYDEGNTFALLRAIAAQEPPDPRTLSANVPKHLASLCRRALDKDPSRRPTAAEFAELLRAGDVARSWALPLLAACVVTLGILGVVAGLVGAQDATLPPPSPVPSASDPGPGDPPRTLDVELGASEWARLLREPQGTPQEQFKAMTQWLGRFPGHPSRGDVLTARRAQQLEFPIARLPSSYHSHTLGGAYLITTRRPGTQVEVWELDPEASSFRRVAEWSFNDHASRLEWVSDKLVACFYNFNLRGVIELRQILTGQVVRTLSLPSLVGTVAASPDGSRLAASGVLADEQRVVRILDAEGGQILVECPIAPVRVTQICFSPRGDRMLVSYGTELGSPLEIPENGLAAFDVASGEELWRQRRPARVGAVAVSLDGTTVFAGTNGGVLQSYEFETGLEQVTFRGEGANVDQTEAFMKRVRAHRGVLRAIQEVDGLGIVSASGDSEVQAAEVRVWSRTGEELHRRGDMASAWQHAHVAANGEWIALVTGDGELEAWSLPRRSR